MVSIRVVARYVVSIAGPWGDNVIGSQFNALLIFYFLEVHVFARPVAARHCHVLVL